MAASGAARHGEKRSWLRQHFNLDCGDANAVALFIDKSLPVLDGAAPAAAGPAPSGDPLASIYAGAKSELRPLLTR